MLYSCTCMATVGVNGLITCFRDLLFQFFQWKLEGYILIMWMKQLYEDNDSCLDLRRFATIRGHFGATLKSTH